MVQRRGLENAGDKFMSFNDQLLALLLDLHFRFPPQIRLDFNG